MTPGAILSPDYSIHWPEHGLEGEAAILADCTALVDAGVATWVDEPDYGARPLPVMHEARRLFAAFKLATDVTACEALLRGERVPRHRLDHDVLGAVGEPVRGEPLALDEALALRVELHVPGRGAEPARSAEERPFAMPLAEFVDEQAVAPPPLLGDERNAIVPAGGLVLIAGRPGIGKTTLAIDLAFHLASGRGWLGFVVPRPLRVLLIENEGPEHMFRAKVAKKRDAWRHPIAGAIYVQTWRWGHFDFGDPEARARARESLADLAIDVVVGDPLGTLGVEGVGSPEDVRRFVRVLVELGLTGTRAFVFLHHFRKEGAEDEVTQLQGAWGGPLDALLTLKPTQRTDEVRLNVAKLRHGTDTLKPVIVGLVRETASFELLGDEGDPRLLETEIVQLLADGVWRTRDEIASRSKRGIGARKETVDACLAGSPHIFRSAPGDEHGRSPRATLWQLAPGVGADRGEYATRRSGEPAPSDPLPVGEEGGASRPPEPPGQGRVTLRTRRRA